MWSGRHGLRVGAYAALAAAAGYAMVGTTWRFGPVLLGAIMGLGYLGRPWLRLLAVTADWSAARRARAAGWVPIIRFLGDVAKVCGYVNGRMRRGGMDGRE